MDLFVGVVSMKSIYVPDKNIGSNLKIIMFVLLQDTLSLRLGCKRNIIKYPYLSATQTTKPEYN